MPLIFLNRFFHPDHSATSQILSDLAFSLAERGFDVHVVTSRQHYDNPRAGLSGREIVKGVTIHRVASSRFGRGNLLGRAIDYLTFYLSAAWRLWRLARKGDVVIAKTDPPLISVPATFVARLRGARLVNWLQDVFPEVAEAAHVGGRAGQLLFSLLRPLRNRSLRAAAINVALGRRMAEHLRKEGVSKDKIRIIPNWQDGKMVRPVPHDENPLREDWELKDKFVVGYSGNLGRVHDLTTILDAMTFLQSFPDIAHKTDKAPEIIFLFIGGGALHEKLADEIARRQLGNVMIKPYQPRDQLAHSLSVADVHLATLRPEFEGLIVPSKFYGIAAAGRATLFVGDEKGEIPRLLTEHQCGLTVQPGDGEGLTRHILTLACDSQLCRQMGQRARALLEERFEKEIAIKAWAEMLNELDQHATAKDRQPEETSPKE